MPQREHYDIGTDLQHQIVIGVNLAPVEGIGDQPGDFSDYIACCGDSESRHRQ